MSWDEKARMRHRLAAEELQAALTDIADEVGQWSRVTGVADEARDANKAMRAAIAALLPIAEQFRDIGGEEEIRSAIERAKAA